MHLSLIRPILRATYKSFLDWILPKIKPLLTVALPTPQTAVEKILLPHWRFAPTGPWSCDSIAPKPRPRYDRCCWRSCRGTEQMQVIRHRDPAPHQPVIGLTPAIQEQGHRLRSCQERATFFHAHRDEDQSGLVGNFQRRKMGQALATCFRSIRSHAECYRKGSIEPRKIRDSRRSSLPKRSCCALAILGWTGPP
jgi:hypothetical protein